MYYLPYISVFFRLKWFTNSITNLYRQCVAHLCFLSSSSSLQKALTLLLISCSIFYVISYRIMLPFLQYENYAYKASHSNPNTGLCICSYTLPHTHTCYVVHIAINNIQESCNAQGQKRLPVVITI